VPPALRVGAWGGGIPLPTTFVKKYHILTHSDTFILKSYANGRGSNPLANTILGTPLSVELPIPLGNTYQS